MIRPILNRFYKTRRVGKEAEPVHRRFSGYTTTDINLFIVLLKNKEYFSFLS
jgi:hypothetical protein